MHLILRRPQVKGTGEIAAHDQTIANYWEQIKNFPSGRMTREDNDALQAFTAWLESSLHMDYRKVEEILTSAQHD